MRGYIPPQTDEERLLVKRVKELADISVSKDIDKHTTFLSDRQQQLAVSALSGFKGEYVLHGGCGEAERKVIFFGRFDDTCLLNSIICLNIVPAFSKINETTLTHRDFLGAFLSLGLKREALGDILPTANGCAVFALPAAAKVIVNELRSVGKYEMRAEEASFENIAVIKKEAQTAAATIASLRLDAVISAMLKISRSAAQQLIASKLVTVNHIEVDSLHYDVQENDVFTVKGYGKYKLCNIGGKSRKDRVFIDYQIY